MVEQDFVFKKVQLVSGVSSYESPSNIALVKYWGKYGEQYPKNQSISFTLSNCKSVTKIKYRPKKDNEINNFLFLFDGFLMPSFNEKIKQFINRISIYIPAIKYHFFEIESYNTFPHSSGIASSASAMSSLALCFMEIEKKINLKISKSYFTKKASFLARLGSGSATRSIEGPVVCWGESEAFNDSSILYGTTFRNIAPIFNSYQDTILIIDKNEKKVSSTLGHHLMESNPYAENRFIQARKNMSKINKIVLGNFLIEEGSLRNWRFVIFLFTMAILMIFSSHSVDKKIISISDFKNEISVLESKFLENRKKVMKLKMESNVALLMKERKIKTSNKPPKKIIIN